MAGVLSVLVVALTASIGFAAGTVRSGGPVVGGDITSVALPPDQTPAPTPDAPATAGPDASPGVPTPTPTLPPLEPAPVPADLAPPLTAAVDDLPVIYADGCHADVAATAPGECVYGVPSGSTTVILFGDSHAAQWFPALERLAREHGWRLVSMTKSGCTTADLPIWNAIYKRGYDECAAWREAALRRIPAENPALVVVSNSSGYKTLVDGEWVPVDEARDRWDAASRRTLERLVATTPRVVVIGDTPRANADPPVCLSENLRDATACAVPYATAVDPAWTAGEATVAAASGAAFIDPTSWVCRTDPCPAVIGRLLVFRDQHHLTATYARALAERLYARLPALDP
jgi:hypothetical protein